MDKDNNMVVPSFIPDEGDYVGVTEIINSVPESYGPISAIGEAFATQIVSVLPTIPAFVNSVKSMVSKSALQAVFTNEQRTQIAEGVIELVRTKDGLLSATLRDKVSKKIVGHVPLQEVEFNPEMLQSFAMLGMQLQMMELAKELEQIKRDLKDIKKGQENDRLAIAYSSIQLLNQAKSIKNKELRDMLLFQVVSEAEKSRNMLMLSIRERASFLKSQPESFIKMVFHGDSSARVEEELREAQTSITVINATSLVAFLAYQIMGEPESAMESLSYYSSFLKTTFTDNQKFIERLDSMASGASLFWTTEIPKISKSIEDFVYNSNQIVSKRVGVGEIAYKNHEM